MDHYFFVVAQVERSIYALKGVARFKIKCFNLLHLFSESFFSFLKLTFEKHLLVGLKMLLVGLGKLFFSKKQNKTK